MITINGIERLDPTAYNDNHDQYFTDSISLAGNRQRNRRAKKKFATLTWSMLTPEEFQEFMDLFEDGDAVTFENTNSSYGTFDFTGMPDLPLGVGDYYGGGTFMRDLTVTLREV